MKQRRIIARIVTGYVCGVQTLKVRAGANGTGRVLFQCRFWKDNSTDAAHAALAEWQRRNPHVDCCEVWGYDKQE